MTTTPPPPGPQNQEQPSGQPTGMPLTIHGQYIKDFSFENPRAPQSLIEQKQPQLTLNVSVATRQFDPKTFEVALVIEASAMTPEKEPLFLIELIYAGTVSMGQVPQEAVAPLLLIETPRLLSPSPAPSSPTSRARRASRRSISPRSISWRSIASSSSRAAARSPACLTAAHPSATPSPNPYGAGLRAEDEDLMAGAIAYISRGPDGPLWKAALEQGLGPSISAPARRAGRQDRRRSGAGLEAAAGLLASFPNLKLIVSLGMGVDHLLADDRCRRACRSCASWMTGWSAR